MWMMYIIDADVIDWWLCAVCECFSDLDKQGSKNPVCRKVGEAETLAEQRDNGLLASHFPHFSACEEIQCNISHERYDPIDVALDSVNVSVGPVTLFLSPAMSRHEWFVVSEKCVCIKGVCLLGLCIISWYIGCIDNLAIWYTGFPKLVSPKAKAGKIQFGPIQTTSPSVWMA